MKRSYLLLLLILCSMSVHAAWWNTVTEMPYAYYTADNSNTSGTTVNPYSGIRTAYLITTHSNQTGLISGESYASSRSTNNQLNFTTDFRNMVGNSSEWTFNVVMNGTWNPAEAASIISDASSSGGYRYLMFSVSKVSGWCDTTNPRFMLFINGQNETLCSETLTLNTSWHMITLTQNATNISVYLDGVRKNWIATTASGAVKDRPQPFTAGNGNLFLGRFYTDSASNTRNFNGTFDEIYFDNVSWTPDIVAAMYNNYTKSTPLYSLLSSRSGGGGASSCDCPTTAVDWYIGGCTITSACAAVGTTNVVYINGSSASLSGANITGFKKLISTSPSVILSMTNGVFRT